MCSSENTSGTSSFSFKEITDAGNVKLPDPTFIQSTDGLNLAYYAVEAQFPLAALIFLHGGGAYSGAGYQFLAKSLSDKYNISVFLLDLRGHGNSPGPRGDSPSVEQVWRDVKALSDNIKKLHPDLRLFLGGHSSGAGLVLNYLSWYRDPHLSGYIFLSPQLGYKSMTERTGNPNPFAIADTDVFVKYAISQGQAYGNTPAVTFNYPDEVMQRQPLLIKSITVFMSLAMTPDNPQEQFKDIDKPFALFIGEKDELFDTEKVIRFADLADMKLRDKSMVRIVEGENHLSILLSADRLIANAIQTMMAQPRPG
jgi:alpha-beta hydrolase superfamily lysophospholipase